MSTAGSTTDTAKEAMEVKTPQSAIGFKEETTVHNASTQKKEINDKPDNVDGVVQDSTAKMEAPLKPRIGYRVEYRNRWTNQLIAEEVQEEGKRTEIHQSDGPIFEVVTSFKVVTETMEAKTDFAINSQSLASYAIRIHSIALINAIQSVVRYYPGQDLSGEYLTIQKPYPILVHHYEQLQEFRSKCLSMPADELCLREKDAAEHLSVLFEYLENEVMEDVREEQERNKRGCCLFDWMWVRFKPGRIMLEKFDWESGWQASVIHSVRGGVLANPSTWWRVENWKLEFDGNDIVRVMNGATHFQQHDGERNYERRPGGGGTIVLEGDDCFDNEEARELIANGKRYMNMLEPKCFQHNGRSVNFPPIEIDGLAMVDMKTYHQIRPDRVPEEMSEDDIRDWASGCSCVVCHYRQRDESLPKTKQPEFLDYGGAPQSTGWRDKEIMLLPSKVASYVFRTRTWEDIYIRNLSEPRFEENMIKHLIMSDSRLMTLKALAKSFARTTQHGEAMKEDRWSADFVRGKGNGLILLLHGKPGVGKTCTAECIAEFTRRPLMILTSSDIGTEPRDVEANLTENFKRAMSWGAVLLIDEADIFMERRTTSDLTRNSLVAGFLRALEFYDGILFLTTNRVGSFDDAFISRIHIQLYYPDFSDDERQKIWKNFIDKLARERGETIRLTIDAKEYIESMRKQGLNWNGREIRNAFQTAVALAEYEADKDSEGRIMVKDDHLRAVVDLSKDFKHYLNDLHKRDEGKRAEQRSERLDSFEGSK
ncbi:hypothetical protein GCG54_00005468 [Colletotrichum gloeosporioides]|uniref:AAA+ ATPase domain-containing protein n=1 Tax=Colletotrichum gloeosporioides TaxID=474922 RepID=A0A8H4CCT4_COLGL|nr:uncharacterized protein GCG54_00005468 [Colletotrichum gloeosporioides]KAF3801312.1 hypothetical protein GCG54_00005468 [Colletotrichum gloeosporioides]